MMHKQYFSLHKIIIILHIYSISYITKIISIDGTPNKLAKGQINAKYQMEWKRVRQTIEKNSNRERDVFLALELLTSPQPSH